MRFYLIASCSSVDAKECFNSFRSLTRHDLPRYQVRLLQHSIEAETIGDQVFKSWSKCVSDEIVAVFVDEITQICDLLPLRPTAFGFSNLDIKFLILNRFRWLRG